jgi:hypothetical protein
MIPVIDANEAAAQQIRVCVKCDDGQHSNRSEPIDIRPVRMK